MTTPQGHVSVTYPVNQAIERMKRVLFQPFDLGKWITIGFCAWLAQLGEGGSGGHFNLPSHHHENVQSLRRAIEQALEYVMQNLYWIVPLVVAVFLAGLVLWVLFLWLSSRGRFMFLHCVAFDRAEVAVPWHKYVREAGSLFWFRLVIGLAGMFITLPALVVAAVAGWRMVECGEPNVGGICVLAGMVLLMVLLGIVFWIVNGLTAGFVVPIMFRRGGGCLAAWGVLLRLLGGNLEHFVLYFLFQIVLGLATGAIVITVVLVTCCILCCALAIPFVGTVLLLPILVFRRAYSLYYLAQYGEEFDAFRAGP